MLLYSRTVALSMYTYTEEPGSSLASCFFWDVIKRPQIFIISQDLKIYIFDWFMWYDGYISQLFSNNIVQLITLHATCIL